MLNFRLIEKHFNSFLSENQFVEFLLPKHEYNNFRFAEQTQVKRYFKIDQEIARHIVQYTLNVFTTPLPL